MKKIFVLEYYAPYTGGGVVAIASEEELKNLINKKCEEKLIADPVKTEIYKLQGFKRGG